MPIDHAHSYLVRPAKNAATPAKIGGAKIQAGSKMHEMLSAVFEKAHEECTIDIVFQPDNDGGQQNDARDLLVDYLTNPRIATGRKIAARLQSYTTLRSGLGLLFLMAGSVGKEKRLVVARFPADQGVIAQENEEELSVEFIEQIFMKSSKAYKSAMFRTSSRAAAGFWDGMAIDKQITGPQELTYYWIRDFLASALRTTSAAGTRRMALALRVAIQTAPSIEIKQDLISTAHLLRARHGQSRSARDLINRLGLSSNAKSVIESGFSNPELMDEVFEFDRIEFARIVTYRTVELESGGMLVATDQRFDQIFHPRIVDEKENVYAFTAEGKIVDTQLRKQK